MLSVEIASKSVFMSPRPRITNSLLYFFFSRFVYGAALVSSSADDPDCTPLPVSVAVASPSLSAQPANTASDENSISPARSNAIRRKRLCLICIFLSLLLDSKMVGVRRKRCAIPADCLHYTRLSPACQGKSVNLP